MTADPYAYFTEQATLSNPDFWRRFGNRPDVAGKRVLDLGCGHGALALELAKEGADVLGLDLDEERIRWGREHLISNALALELRAAPIETLTEAESFHLVVCKDTLEHLADVRGTLHAIRHLLKPGGEAWIGSAPLYYSPWGDHNRTAMPGPWLHTLPLTLVLGATSRQRGTPVSSLTDLGLNGLTPAEFRRLATDSGLAMRSVLYNRGDKRLLSALSRLRAIPGLERYCTVSIYAVLVRVS